MSAASETEWKVEERGGVASLRIVFSSSSSSSSSPGPEILCDPDAVVSTSEGILVTHRWFGWWRVCGAVAARSPSSSPGRRREEEDLLLSPREAAHAGGILVHELRGDGDLLCLVGDARVLASERGVSIGSKGATGRGRVALAGAWTAAFLAEGEARWIDPARLLAWEASSLGRRGSRDRRGNLRRFVGPGVVVFRAGRAPTEPSPRRRTALCSLLVASVGLGLVLVSLVLVASFVGFGLGVGEFFEDWDRYTAGSSSHDHDEEHSYYYYTGDL